MLEQKLAEAKSKKDTLKARAKSAAASKQITEMIQGLNTSNALTAFEKMEEKVMSLEAESESTLQVFGKARHCRCRPCTSTPCHLHFRSCTIAASTTTAWFCACAAPPAQIRPFVICGAPKSLIASV